MRRELILGPGSNNAFEVMVTLAAGVPFFIVLGLMVYRARNLLRRERENTTYRFTFRIPEIWAVTIGLIPSMLLVTLVLSTWSGPTFGQLRTEYGPLNFRYNIITVLVMTTLCQLVGMLLVKLRLDRNNQVGESGTFRDCAKIISGALLMPACFLIYMVFALPLVAIVFAGIF